jgi:Tol biopolymer transport system component
VVAFGSFATDLGNGQADAQGFQDLFAFARRSAEVTPLTQRAADLPAVTPFGPSAAAGISADGRYVLFFSKATGLVPGQVDKPWWNDDPFSGESGSWDVFLRDRTAGKTTLLSRSKASPPTAMGNVFQAVLSADGRFAAFEQGTSGLSANPVYLYDRTTDGLTLVNYRPGSPGEPDGLASPQAISADGRYLAYECSGCHLAAGGEAAGGLFLYDRGTGASTLIDSAAGANGFSSQARLSADGRFAVFLSNEPQRNVFLYDTASGAITLVSHAAGSPAAAANGGSSRAEISADGRWIAFSSAATDLAPGQSDANGMTDVFLYDRLAGTSVLISHAAASALTAGAGASGDSDSAIALSADGRFLAFVSNATDLVPGLVNPGQSYAVYLYDRLAGGTTLVSHAFGAPATVPNNGSYDLALSADGSRIAFVTYATDVAPGQSAATRSADLILYDRATGTLTRAGRAHPSTAFGVELPTFLSLHLSAGGLQVAFTSDAADLVAGDFNDNWDAFLYDATAGPVTVPPCALFDSVLRSNVRQAVTTAGACGVPAGAKQVMVKLTVSQGTGKGNVRLYPGDVTNPSSGILRFSQGMTQSAGFIVPLGNGAVAVLPFVAGNGTVRVSLEVDGYVP